jgi:hypothetical protein
VVLLLWVQPVDLENRTHPATRPRAPSIGGARCRVHASRSRVAHPGHGHHRRSSRSRTARITPSRSPFPSTSAHERTPTTTRHPPAYRDTPMQGSQTGSRSSKSFTRSDRDGTGNRTGTSAAPVPAGVAGRGCCSRPRCARLGSRPCARFARFGLGSKDPDQPAVTTRGQRAVSGEHGHGFTGETRRRRRLRRDGSRDAEVRQPGDWCDRCPVRDRRRPAA